MTPVSPVGGEVDVEALASEICREHDAEISGPLPGEPFPCAGCRYEARIVLASDWNRERDARLEAAESARDEALAVVERVRAAVYWGRSDGWVWKRDLRAALTPSAPIEEER